MEKKRKKVKPPFKKGRGEGHKREREKEKINLLELNFFSKSPLWLKNGKGKEKNQSVGVALRASRERKIGL